MARSPLFSFLSRSLGRREFVKTIAAAAMVAPLAPSLTSAALAAQRIGGGGIRGRKPSTGAAEDAVIIVGGGLAGLVTAYRLSRAGVPCEIYEASQRLGGRVITQPRFNAEGMHVELGGEFIDTSHDDLLSLLRELGLELDDVRMAALEPLEPLLFVGGRRYSERELIAACAPLSKRLLRDARRVFRSMADPVITYRDHTEEAARLDRVTLAEYLASMRGEVDRWALDAVAAAYESEFGLATSEQSSLNLTLMIDPASGQVSGLFGESDVSFRVRGGNSRLVEGLSSALSGRVPSRLDRRLVRVRAKGPGLELVFADGDGRDTEARVASQVVCALPFSTLRDVEGLGTLGLSPVKLRCIRELGYGTHAKRILGFRGRAWHAGSGGIPPYTGDVITDLPSQEFWDASRAQRGTSGILTNFTGGPAGRDEALNTFEIVMRDADRIQPGIRALHDGNHSSYRWAGNPLFKGSYACPRPGQYTTIMGSPKEAELGGRLLFAGEHVSEQYQGYMSGAVESANQAARRIILQRGRRALLDFAFRPFSRA